MLLAGFYIPSCVGFTITLFFFFRAQLSTEKKTHYARTHIFPVEKSVKVGCFGGKTIRENTRVPLDISYYYCMILFLCIPRWSVDRLNARLIIGIVYTLDEVVPHWVHLYKYVLRLLFFIFFFSITVASFKKEFRNEKCFILLFFFFNTSLWRIKTIISMFYWPYYSTYFGTLI